MDFGKKARPVQMARVYRSMGFANELAGLLNSLTELLSGKVMRPYAINDFHELNAARSFRFDK